MSRHLRTALITAGLLFSVSACSTSSSESAGTDIAGVDANESGSQVELVITDIEDAQIDLNALGDKDWKATVDSALITYESAGSGSCKPIIEKAVLDGKTVTLTRFDYTGKPCTMDLRQYRQEIATPDGSDFPEDVEVVMVDPTTIK